MQEPSLPQLPAPSSAHWSSGSWPPGTAVHAPALPASAQEVQVPLQAVLQQTPCAHCPLAHSVAPPHAVPRGFNPHEPFTQTLGAVQSPSCMQVALQAAASPQVNGAQLRVVAGLHFPAPSQVRTLVSVLPVQLPATQVVPVTYRRQAPRPSQLPSFPQVGGDSDAHTSRGSFPADTGAQVPTAPAPLHA